MFKSETVGLKTQRMKQWAKEEWLSLKPGTRAALKGLITAAKIAAAA